MGRLDFVHPTLWALRPHDTRKHLTRGTRVYAEGRSGASNTPDASKTPDAVLLGGPTSEPTNMAFLGIGYVGEPTRKNLA